MLRLKDIEHNFGKNVARMMEGLSNSLTDDPGNRQSWQTRKESYIERLRHPRPRAVYGTDTLFTLAENSPLFFHTVLETGRTEALVYFHIVENLPAVFKPEGVLIAVFLLVAGGPYFGGKVVQQNDQLLRFNETGRMYIPYFFHCPKALAHCLATFLLFASWVFGIR
jgi:hypothetical protein